MEGAVDVPEMDCARGSGRPAHRGRVSTEERLVETERSGRTEGPDDRTPRTSARPGDSRAPGQYVVHSTATDVSS